MLHEQRWTPDTCANPAAGDACQLVMQWDDAVPAEERVHTLVRVESVCSHHAQFGTPANVYAANLEWNRRKNIAHAEARSIKPDLALEDFRWSFDQLGILTIRLGNRLNAAQKAQLELSCVTRFGAGKVVVT